MSILAQDEARKAHLLRNIEFLTGLIFDASRNDATVVVSIRLHKGRPNGFRREETLEKPILNINCSEAHTLLKSGNGNVVLMNQKRLVTARTEENFPIVD